MCSHVCSVCYWLIGDSLLMCSGVVSLRLHLPCFDVCWIFGVLVGVVSVWQAEAVFLPSNFGIPKMYGYSCELSGATGVVDVWVYRTGKSYKTVMALQKERLKCFDHSVARVSFNLR